MLLLAATFGSICAALAWSAVLERIGPMPSVDDDGTVQ